MPVLGSFPSVVVAREAGGLFRYRLLLHADSQSRDPGARFASSGSADAILALVKAGASVEASDKDGLTGKVHAGNIS